MSQFFARMSPSQRSLLGALAGFVFYGMWAFWVNRDYGVAAGLKAACVQGGYSFALTFVMTLVIERLYQLFFAALNNTVLIIWMTIALTCAFIFTTSWWLNVLAGTPEIFHTVVLGYVIGGVYTVVYVYGLANSQKAKVEAS